MDSDVSKVIERTALIENIIDQIIINYTNPREEVYGFFMEILLDSSIMPLGSKVKVVMAISQQFETKLDKNSLHEVLSYRNAFAHHSLNSHPTIIASDTPEKSDGYYSLQVIKSSGKTERTPREVAYQNFNKYYGKAKESLLALREKVGDYRK